jgi:glycosyltransferase involved in cell wall biosynthesis
MQDSIFDPILDDMGERVAKYSNDAAPVSERYPQVVLVYRRDLLPLSETFIKEQVLAYHRWKGVVIGRRLLSALPLDGLAIEVLEPLRAKFLSRLWWRVSQTLSAAPFPVIARLRRRKPALLHVHFGLDAIHAWPIARALHVPMVVTLHGYDVNITSTWWESGRGGRRYRHYPAQLRRLATQPHVHFIAVSKAIKNKAIDFGIPSAKISVMYIGVDVRRFAPATSPTVRSPRVLFVGRLVEKKGCDVLIRAMAYVQAAVAGALLVIIGEGDLRAKLEFLAKSLGVRAIFLGALSSDQVRNELQSARVLCAPSVTASNGDAEGLPLVLLEAQASGVPVVVSAHGGCTEAILEGGSGRSFPERDLLSLSRHLITLLSDDLVYAKMARAGPLFMRDQFDILHRTVELESLYDLIVAKYRG